MLVVSCSGYECPATPEERPAALRLVYLGGGPAPLGADLFVFTDGTLRLIDFRDREHCRRDPELARRIVEEVASPEVRSTLAAVKRCPARYSIHDAEQVVFVEDGEEISVAMSRLPPELAKLLEQLDSAFSEAFGRAYRVSLKPHGTLWPTGTDVADCPEEKSDGK